MVRKLLCIGSAAVVGVLAMAIPAGASTMPEIYGGLRIEGLQASPEYIAGETVFPAYSLVNRSGTTLEVPPNTEFGATFHLVGILQHWIERLGPVKTIPSLQTFFDGSRYAAGGSIAAVDGRLPANLWAPGLALPFGSSVDTSGFPTGNYRFYVEYKQLFSDGGAVIQTVTVDFHVVGTEPEDTTPPTLVVADVSVDATSPDGAQAFWDATAADDLDPNPVVACDPASGSAFPIGTTIVTCTATDASGNQDTESFTVHVKGDQEQLIDLVQLVDEQELGPGSSLHAKLVRARQQLEAGEVDGACGVLDAFVLSVRAQTDEKLTGAQAAELTSYAQRIQNVLGC